MEDWTERDLRVRANLRIFEQLTIEIIEKILYPFDS